jgi:hypothetical protein
MKMLSTVALLTLWACAAASTIPVVQQPLANPDTNPTAHVVPDDVHQPPAGVAAPGPRGRFLHITGTYWI